jgi:hypothetical protein
MAAATVVAAAEAPTQAAVAAASTEAAVPVAATMAAVPTAVLTPQDGIPAPAAPVAPEATPQRAAPPQAGPGLSRVAVAAAAWLRRVEPVSPTANGTPSAALIAPWRPLRSATRPSQAPPFAAALATVVTAGVAATVGAAGDGAAVGDGVGAGVAGGDSVGASAMAGDTRPGILSGIGPPTLTTQRGTMTTVTITFTPIRTRLS